MIKPSKILTNNDLLQALENVPKLPGCLKYPPSPLCNRAYPGTFNLSLIEYDMLNKFEGYLDINQDLIYTKVQPVIRFNDWEDILKDPVGSQHLLLFHMADVGGLNILYNPVNKNTAISHSVRALCNFLTETMGLDPQLLIFKTLAEGFPVSHISAGKYNFGKIVPKFQLLEDILFDLGFSKENILYDSTRDTFLCLNVYGNPSPWGYRSEVLYNYRNAYLDIATIEHLIYRPVFKDGDIVDFVDWEHSFSTAGAGLERIAMVSRNLEWIGDLFPYNELLDLIKANSRNYDTATAFLLAQLLVAMRYLIPEYSSIAHSSNRKRKFNSLKRDYQKIVKQLQITNNYNILSCKYLFDSDNHFSRLPQIDMDDFIEILNSYISSGDNNV